MDKVWIIEDPDELLRRPRTRRTQTEAPEKNPAKAYSWSVLLWGGGQYYNNQGMKGFCFYLLMFAFYNGTVFTVMFWRDIVQFLRDSGISVSVFLLVALALQLCTLISWSLCCSNAYHEAAKTRKKRFSGTRSRVFPFLCSLLLPGWGQFLNGQPLKGSVFAGFSVVSYFSLVAIPAILLAWKDLEPSTARFLVESVFTIAVLFVPLIPFVWMFSSYDALKVSLYELKKDPLWARIKAANNRRRNQGWVRGIFPQLKRTFVLVLFLAFFLIVVYNYSPQRFYAGELASARSSLQSQEMTLLPDLLRWLFPYAAGGI
jgi:TM2 domain-containing membrane protein YozV